MCHLAEAHAAESEFPVDRVRTAAALAAGVTAHLELRLPARLNLEACLCHSLSLPGLLLCEWESERAKQSATFIVILGCGDDRDVHAADAIDLVLWDLSEYDLLGYTEGVVALAIELLR